MSIGIYDADIANYILVPFNLEAMKLSAYYKSKREIVILSPQPNPEKNTKFYYIKDYDDGIYPSILSQPNVEYRGLAFSNNIYKPMANAIEMCRPDTHLYSKMRQRFSQQINGEKIFSNLTSAEHCRLSLDGADVWSDYESQLNSLQSARTILFHDYDLGRINNGFKEVKSILARGGKGRIPLRVGMKFPVQVDQGNDLINWSSLNTNSIFYSLRYNGVIPKDCFVEWVGDLRDRAVFSQIEYFVTDPRYTEQEFISVHMPRLFQQVLISRSYRVFFSLKYDEDYFIDKRWCQVLHLFNLFMNSLRGFSVVDFLRKVSDDTMFNYASRCADEPKVVRNWRTFSRDEIREIFNFVRENNYDLFKMFYECTAEKLGGKIE